MERRRIPATPQRLLRWERLTRAATPALLQAVGLEPGERLLDIGCGVWIRPRPGAFAPRGRRRPDDTIFDDAELRRMGVPADRMAEARDVVEAHLARFRKRPGTSRIPLAYLIVAART